MFWIYHWLDGRPLKERFSRLFDLAENKRATIVEKNDLGWGELRGVEMAYEVACLGGGVSVRVYLAVNLGCFVDGSRKPMSMDFTSLYLLHV